jgi:hypothetical protein
VCDSQSSLVRIWSRAEKRYDVAACPSVVGGWHLVKGQSSSALLLALERGKTGGDRLWVAGKSRAVDEQTRQVLAASYYLFGFATEFDARTNLIPWRHANH